MKVFIALCCFSLTSLALAQDMSRTESWEESYREEEDGSSRYIGGCSLHEDYEGEHFTVGKTIVKYFEPGYRETEADILARMGQVDARLLQLVAEHVGEGFPHVDDFTMVKLHSSRFPELNLYRFSIGVGGGNGMFLVYRKTGRGAQANYQLVTDTFDGDLNFCDRSVWTK